jgi:hypothetical protein
MFTSTPTVIVHSTPSFTPLQPSLIRNTTSQQTQALPPIEQQTQTSQGVHIETQTEHEPIVKYTTDEGKGLLHAERMISQVKLTFLVPE